jgi:sucrose-6-phosphate hydrolase SacC (GH32 family)
MRERSERNVTDRINAARAKADVDPLRPAFHFHPPAQWMNAPSGTVYEDGYYHVFYQHNPFADSWNHIHWGHARTRDFVEWERLPIALVPDDDAKEIHCFSGCCVVIPGALPRIIYTSVSANRDRYPNRQRLAVGNHDLTLWEKTESPVLEIANAPVGTCDDWRDPYVFEDCGAYYMVLGAAMSHQEEDRAVVLLYKCEDQDLSRWRYIGPLYMCERDITFPECPNFFRLHDRWVLIVSPFGPVRYHIGSATTTPESFTPEHHGIMDHSSEYYATNTILHDGRVIVFARVRGFPKGRGGNGCLAIPRELEICEDGTLIQRPIEEVKSYRRAEFDVGPAELRKKKIVLEEAPVWGLELHCTLNLPRDSQAYIRLSNEKESVFTIGIDAVSNVVHAEGTPVPLADRRNGTTEHSFRIFVDRSVVEVFIDGGRECVTRCAENLIESNRLILETAGQASFTAVRYWEMSQLEYRDST